MLFIHGILGLLQIIIWIYILLMVANGLTSLFGADATKPFVKFINVFTKPLLDSLVKKFPKLRQDEIDFSPWVVVLILLAIEYVVIKPLYYDTMLSRF